MIDAASWEEQVIVRMILTTLVVEDLLVSWALEQTILI